MLIITKYRELIFMKKLFKSISVLICLIMVVGLMLPMAGVAGAAATGTRYDVETDVEFGNALNEPLVAGDTIRITGTNTTIEYTHVVEIGTGGIITIQLNGNTLTLKPTPNEQIVMEIDDTRVNVVGPGTLNIINESTATDARSAIGVEVTGTSQLIGSAGARINIETTAAAGSSIYVAGGTSTIAYITDIGAGPLTVTGGAIVTVTGAISSSGTALRVIDSGSTVTVNGNITGRGTGGTGVLLMSSGTGTSKVIVNGTITAPTYIAFQNGATTVTRSATQYNTVVTEGGTTYRQFDGPVGTTSTPSTPGIVQVRAPAGSTNVVTGSGNNTIDHTEANGVITLNMDTALIDAIVGAVSGTGQVNINLSSLTGTAVSLPREFFEKVSSDRKTARIEMPEGTVTFSSGALTTIAGAGSSGGNIEISLHVATNSQLNSAQQRAINATDKAYSITISAGSQIRTFNGIMTFTIPYTGPFPAVAWLVSDTGNLTRATNSSYSSSNNTVTFTANRLSIYIIRSSTTEVPQTSDDVNIFALCMIVLAAVGGLVTLVVIKKRYMTEKR